MVKTSKNCWGNVGGSWNRGQCPRLWPKNARGRGANLLTGDNVPGFGLKTYKKERPFQTVPYHFLIEDFCNW